MAATVVVLASLGCGIVPLDEVLPAPDQGIEVTAEDIEFGFAAPTQVIVKRGDSLSKIALRHDVTVDDLRGWNALETDDLEIGQVLFVWEEAPELGSIDVASAGQRARPVPVPNRAAPAPEPAPARSMWRAAQRAVFGTSDETPAPAPAPTAPPEVGDPVQVASVDNRRTLNVDRTLLKGSGILDADVGSDAGVDLARSASGMARHNSEMGEGLGARSLGDQGTGEALNLPDREMRDYGSKIPDKPVKAPRLSKPRAKRCLSGPSATMDEKGMVTNNGLDAAQINAGMGRISRYTMRCFPRGTEGTYQVIVEVKVGCNGLVDNVYTVGAGAVPSHVTSCIEQTLGYASFSAHAVPNGVSFQYPLKFTF